MCAYVCVFQRKRKNGRRYSFLILFFRFSAQRRVSSTNLSMVFDTVLSLPGSDKYIHYPFLSSSSVFYIVVFHFASFLLFFLQEFFSKGMNPLNFRSDPAGTWIRTNPETRIRIQDHYCMVKVRVVGEGTLSLWVLYIVYIVYLGINSFRKCCLKTFFLSKYKTPNRRRSIDHRKYLKVGATLLSSKLSLFASGCRPRSGVPSKRRVMGP